MIGYRAAHEMDEAPVSARDILVPKILVTQPTSKFVHDEKSKPGEIRESLEARLVAAKGQGAEVIAFNFFKTRITFKIVKKKANDAGKQEFAGQVPWTPAFEVEKPKTGQWTEVISGEEYVHYETINYYALFPDQIKDGTSFPHLMSFRSTGYKAGKTLESWRLRLQMSKKKIYEKVFLLSSEQTENDKGTFYVPVVVTGRDATRDEVDAVETWKRLIGGANVTIDHSDLETPAVEVETKTAEGMNTNF